MTCQPFDPNGEQCVEDYLRQLDEEHHDIEQERTHPSTAPTDDEHQEAIRQHTYPSRTEALSEGVRGLLDGR